MIIEAIRELAPNAEFTITDSDLSTLVWHSDDIPQPTDDQITTRANELTSEEPLRKLRHERNIMLTQTDWWVMPDRTATQAQLDYRQALRDITQTYTSLEDVVWPEKPE